MSQRYIGGLIYNPPGGFSGYFDGSGDYLTAGTTSSFNFLHNTTALFTIEAWVYVTVGSSYNTLIDTNGAGSVNIGCWFAVNNDNKLRVFITKGSSGNPVIDASSSTTVPLNQWVHVAVTYDQSLGSNNATFYINGVASGNGTKTANAPSNSNATYALQVSAASGGSGYFNGYISNLRINNSIVYSAAFTPPVGQLQAITNTSLLTCAYPTFRDGSTNNFTITVNGNTAVSTQNPFPLTQLPNPALGNQGNGVYSMSQYQALKQQNLWPAIDQYWPYVTLMLHGNGTNGAQNNTFLDSSTNNFTITRNGNTTQGTFTPYGSNWSNYFDGSSSYLTVPDNAALEPGSSDLTWEMWINTTNSTQYTTLYSRTPASFATGMWSLLMNFASSTAGDISLFVGDYAGGATALLLTTGVSVRDGAWHHIAIVRNGSAWTLYVDGISRATQTWSGTIADIAGNPYIGADQYYGRAYTGYISNLRILKGTALYTSAFTPPTAPLTAITNTSLLTCQSNRFIDNSTNAFSLTVNGSPSVQRFSPFAPTTPYAADVIGGSGYFDGSGDYLSVADNSSLEGFSDFTIEFWLNLSSVVNGTCVLTKGWSSGAYAPYLFYVNGTNLAFYASSDNANWNISNNTTITALTAGQWYHIAVSRSGSSLRVFANGSLVTTITSSVALMTNASALTLGADATGANAITGYVSSARITNTAVYTAAFTPPTTPLTAITNTSLLLNFTNGGIIDNAMMNDLETVGNAQISTSVSKFGGGSLAFDGNGDYLIAPNRATLVLANGDFTIELWAYFNSLPGGNFKRILSFQNGSAQNSNYSYIIQVNSSNTIEATLVNGSTLSTVTSSTVVTTGVWYHIAFVRTGSTNKLYVNGVSEGTPTSVASFNTISDGRLGIGLDLDGTSFPLNGYIDDLRITKYARYTANFTPQRSQWQDQ